MSGELNIRMEEKRFPCQSFRRSTAVIRTGMRPRPDQVFPLSSEKRKQSQPPMSLRNGLPSGSVATASPM